jgi:hypothetical protein
MTPRALRAWRPALALAPVLGLTPALVRANPPEPDPAIEQAEASQVSVEIISSALAIVVVAVPLDGDGQPSGPAIELGAPPITTTLAPGRWRLETRGRGYQPWSRELQLEAGVEQRIQIEPTLIEDTLLELRAVNSAAEGATVELDGARLCSVPCSVGIAPGRHAITIGKRRYKPLRSNFDAAQADEITFDVALHPATSRAPALVTGIVGLGSLTTAIVFTVRSARASNSLEADLAAGVQYDQHDRRLENGQRDAVIATAMYGVTAVAGGLTLYYLLRQAGRDSQAIKRRRSLAWQFDPLALAVRF